MAKTDSLNIPMGTIAPNFTLQDQISQEDISLKTHAGKISTIIIFMCNHCPFVIHIIEEFVELMKEFETKGINCIAINSNDVASYPADSPEHMKIFANENNFSFPYVYDKTQSVAKIYQAQCTPDIYVYNSDLQLTYHGRFDDSTPGNNIPVNGNELRETLNAIVNNEEIIDPQYPSVGCNIKWIE